MHKYQREFIELARKYEVLRFGRFTLKSGRESPYFFNAGAFNTGAAWATLGRCYAQRIVDSQVAFDVLLGPAYKGIPLATATAVALSTEHGRDVSFAYNRKEAKAHGEGGSLVGAPLQGRVLITDDVITAGTAVGEVINMIEAANAELAGVLIGLNRQERGRGNKSAIQEIEDRWGVPVLSIITMADLINYLEASSSQLGGANACTEVPEDALDAMRAYRDRYGV